MKRLVSIGVILVAAIVFYLVLQTRPVHIALLDATATAGHGGASSFAIGMTIQNSGPPDTLLGATSPEGLAISLMSAQGASPLVIPGDSEAVLAMDGAHLMVMAPDLQDGGFLPVTLSFANAGAVSTRVQVAAAMPMMHDMMGGVSETPAPRVAIEPVGTPTADGFEVALAVENFSFLSVADGTPHVAGEGHAHIYLNGLKLARVYTDRYRIGALPAGSYTLQVSLNAHDHRPYMDGDEPVSATYAFVIPES